MTIDPGDFWQLRARIRDVDAIELELLKQRMEGTARLNAARQQVTATIDRLAKKYAFPADGAWRLDDATCTVTPQAEPVGKPVGDEHRPSTPTQKEGPHAST